MPELELARPGDTPTDAAGTVTDEASTNDALIALAAGAVGAILTALIAFGLRVTRVGAEIRANDRALRVLDDHLETWVADETVNLRRNITRIKERLAADNLLDSGAYGYKIGLAKEAALHAYRDQERTAISHEADVIGRETWMHDLWRSVRYRRLVRGLSAPARVKPVLDAWASPIVRHGFPTVEVDDPRDRNVEKTLETLAPNALS